jgi:hypothetical protein
VTATFQLGAAIGLVPPSVSLSAAFQGGQPAPVQVQITNVGQFPLLNARADTAVAYGAGATGWLFVTQQGNLINLTAVTGQLNAGSYTATVHVAAQNAPTVDLPVSLTIGTPIIRLSSSLINFAGPPANSNILSQSVGISNSGAGTFADLGAVTVGTITINSPVGVTWAGASIVGNQLTVTATSANLPAGVYTANVQVLSTRGGNTNVSVVFNVQ